MARPTKEQTRKRLRDAVVAEAIERGFNAMSVGGVVNRAKVSAGTVYVHFDNKDDMLQKVFLEIKAEFHAAMVAAKSEPDSAAMVRRMWFDMFNFVRRQPRDFLYLEYVNSSRILTDDQVIHAQEMTMEIAQMFQRGIDDGTLADIGVQTISLLLVAPALQMARGAVQSGQDIPDDVTQLVFDRVWLSIRA